MKVTYKFINDLIKLLKNENWQLDLEKRLNQIEQELVELATNTNNQINKIKSKWAELKSEGKKYPNQDLQEQAIKNRLGALEKEKSKLKQEQMDIEGCLKKGEYKLGLGVFKNIENAQLLLTNVHFLYAKEFGFNSDAVKAVESMLETNFDILYSAEVNESLSKSSYEYKKNEATLVEKFLSNKINDAKVEDLFHHYNDVPREDQNRINKFFNSIKKSDPALVGYIHQKLSPFKYFYSSGDLQCSLFTFRLSIYFSSTEDIDNYLEKEIDFSSLETIENAIMIAGLNLDISELSEEEIEIWQKLNAEFGKEAIKLFGQVNDLKKILDLKAVKEDLEKTKQFRYENLLKIINEQAELICFEREQEKPELAQLIRKYKLDEYTFNRILDDILPQKKDHDLLPDVEFQLSENKKYTFKKLPAGDLRGLLLGKMTDCCQFVGGDAEEKAVIPGFTREDAGFYILEDKKGIKAQSYAWIGVNEDGKDVLVLDSFEYIPGLEKYFVELVKKLSSEIKVFGFEELYVGRGGKTPRLDMVNTHKIAAKNNDLPRYHDSDSLYKICDDTIKSVTYISERMYKNFAELTTFHPYLSIEKIKEMDTEGKLDELNESSLHAISGNSAMIAHLLETGYLTIERMIELFSVDDNQENFSPTRYSQNFQQDVLVWKIALAACSENCDYYSFTELTLHIKINHDLISKAKEILTQFGESQEAWNLIGERICSKLSTEHNHPIVNQSINNPNNKVVVLGSASDYHHDNFGENIGFDE